MTNRCSMARWAVALVVMAGAAATARAADLEPASIRDRIVYETQTDGNWELFVMNADGSDPANLTRTPGVDELYPHVSPDGTKIAFVADEGKDAAKVRSVYYMNADGTGRVKIARNGRQQCWSPDGSTIAYLNAEFDKFVYTDYATKGIAFYDLKTGKTRQHPNSKIHHLYNLCYSPDGKWFVATVHGGMGFKHAILAIQADGPGVFDLKIPGCRPDISPDGTKIAWGASDWHLDVGDLDLSLPTPKVTGRRHMVISAKPIKIYHIDWSPDGKYVAFSRGPNEKSLGHAPEIVGVPAKGWDICIADAAETNKWKAITSNGNGNKEPDWMPAGGKPKQ